MAADDVGALLRAARGRFGLTQAAAGRMLGFSADMVSKIERGKTPGGRYEQSVRELASRGTVVHPPPRRRQRVRAPGGRTVEAPRTPPPLRRAPGRRFFGVQRQATPSGGRQTVVDVPKRGPNRKRAEAELVDDLSSAPDDLRVTMWTTTRAGRVHETGTKGGYIPSTMLRLIRSRRNLWRWISDQLDQQGYDVAPGDIATVTLSYV